ncbi:CBS domain-containing protein [Rubripirellula amarantea]|uniref:Inosine 5'-monophosphate dehydrogenase n=1 Tax=Rubripirellula amarantea TaxID=2527999 RepID=A0A5C5WYK2_9BACT|nr:CBS domain-containing protein [Rubripirellula amarantea]MDA8745205.1 CBS domain-containing protein [Rubripirellula amarantea]TWT54972.1 inosine 5'-monophosphate dehydrogenase [Rubripirellula amarantea]
MSLLNAMSQRSVIRSADEIMRRKLVTLSATDDLFHSVGRLLSDNISGAPVVDQDRNYLGVLSEKCCITALTDPVEVASEVGLHVVQVREFMVADLVTLDGEMDVFDAIDHLLSHRISGAPVTDKNGRFRGIFSEKTAMRVLSAALLDGLPGTKVESYMNVDQNRIINEGDLLIDVAHKFQNTPYRRLPVLRNGQLIGQVSRRDVLRAEHRLAAEVIGRGNKPGVSERLRRAIEPKQVGDCMDTEALTTPPTTDLLGIAQVFLNSPYRRLPVVEHGKLLGMISRRDLLQAAASIMTPAKKRGQAETLYLSGLYASPPPSIG